MVGNKGFAEHCSRLLDPSAVIRVVHDRDPVTKVPSLHDYHHFGQLFKIKQGRSKVVGPAVQAPIPLKAVLDCSLMLNRGQHSMANYLEQLEQADFSGLLPMDCPIASVSGYASLL